MSNNINHKLEIICPAGTLAALKVAVDEGADAVYVGFRDETNARNFPGLNFNYQELKEGVEYAHKRSRMVFVAINTYARASFINIWHKAIDDAVRAGADAIILADIGLLDYACKKYPNVRLHLSVQASASTIDAIRFYVDNFNVKRVVLPRVLTLSEISDINNAISVETEVFAFGGMCPMAEGRCSLSSYITGKSPNQHGVCSPASHVKYQKDDNGLKTTLAGYTINHFEEEELAGYPTLCKGRFAARGELDYLFEEPISLNTIDLLPEIIAAKVSAIKIEGRQRGSAYVREVMKTFRRAVDACYNNDSLKPNINLSQIAEGRKTTEGAYDEKWR